MSAEVGTSEALVGIWHLVRSEGMDHEAAELDFRADGTMVYSIRVVGRWQVINLAYRIEGNVLVSHQPSAPSEQRSTFVIDEDGQLVVDWAGGRAWFRRGEKRAPSV